MSEHRPPTHRIIQERGSVPGELPLPEKVMLLLHPLAIKRTLINKSVLFRENQAPEDVYLLYSGMVRLSASSLDGRSLTIRLATSGEVLGLSSLFSEKPHHMTAECLTDVCIGVVPKDALYAFMTDNPSARLPLLQLLSEEVNVYRDLIRTFVHAA